MRQIFNITQLYGEMSSRGDNTLSYVKLKSFVEGDHTALDDKQKASFRKVLSECLKKYTK